MNTCEQKLGIFILKRCENRAKHQCVECKNHFCETHFEEDNLCKSCFSKQHQKGSFRKEEDDDWYWDIQRTTLAQNLAIGMLYSENDNEDLIMNEFDSQEYLDVNEFDESDVSFFDS